jgi:hypothetical protein
MRLEVPEEEMELFLDNADVPHVKIHKSKGRKVWPLSHKLVRGFVTEFLHQASGGILPNKSEVDAFVNLLEAKALVNGRRDAEIDWQDNVLDQDPLTLCLYTLVLRKAPSEWDATSGEIMLAVNVLAAKEGFVKSDNWPPSPQQMSIELAKRIVVLGELGVIVTKLPRSGAARKWRLQMTQSDTLQVGITESSLGSSESKSLNAHGLDRNTATDDALAAELESILNQERSPEILTPDQISHWIPSEWTEFKGNSSAVEKLVLTLDDLVAKRPCKNVLLIGAKNTGRDALITHSVNALLCEQPTNNLDPCGSCPNCAWQIVREEAFGTVRKDDEFQYVYVDCPNLNENKLVYESSRVKGFQGRLLVFLSQVDLLPKDRIPDLLTVMEDERFFWFATATDIGRIDQEVLKHFEVEMTNNPPEDELAQFLAERCSAWGIALDSPLTLVRLAHVCGQVVGDTLIILSLAAGAPGRQLTRELVEANFAKV